MEVERSGLLRVIEELYEFAGKCADDYIRLWILCQVGDLRSEKLDGFDDPFFNGARRSQEQAFLSGDLPLQRGMRDEITIEGSLPIKAWEGGKQMWLSAELCLDTLCAVSQPLGESLDAL